MLTPHIQKLAQELGELLVANEQTVTCAESCTGGGLAFAITSVPGSSQWFHQGFVTYSNQVKHQQLGVSLKTLEQFGAVSEQTVAEMAQGALTVAKANLGVAISGIAGPDGGSIDKPVGTVCFGFSFNGKTTVYTQYFVGDRDHVREKSIIYVIEKSIEIISS